MYVITECTESVVRARTGRGAGKPGVTALIVLGMHRSGTSSVAGALVRLGGEPPAHLMPPAPSNERGFWESCVVRDLNDDILREAGTRWDDWRAFDRSRIGAGAEGTLRKRAIATLAAEFSGARMPVVKDPRMCRLMSFWGPVFADAGWSTRVVLPIRSPLEVARSLERRDGIPPSVGCLVWLRHVLDAEAETRGAPRAFIDWSAFLSDRAGALYRVARRLGIVWPRGAIDVSAVDDFVSGALRHFEAGANEIAVDPAISRLAWKVYRLMLALADDPDDRSALSGLDRLRFCFEQAADVFHPVIGHLEERAELSERAASAVQAKIAALEAELDATRRKLADAHAAIADIATRYATLHRAQGRGALAHLRPVDEPLEAIRASAFFDALHYLTAYPDVRAAGGDPAEHYLTLGAREGRDPGPHFSSTDYWARNPDVQAFGVNPLLHYECYGRAEGRAPID